MSADTLPSLEGIAIVGMAGRFPGAADIDAFWDNLTAGRETIRTFDLDAIPAEERKYDSDYVPRRGVIDRPEWFDAAFFNISPREAMVIEPQQRLFLESCWHALEHAGCDPQRFAGSIGVYAGMSNNSWFQREIFFNNTLRDQIGYETAMIANEKDYLATRAAYKLNLKGPALNIYTACSTSLVAVCQAVQGLLSYQCDAALAGGVSVKWPQNRGYTYLEGGILSPDGHCRSYDADAKGTVFSSGLGVVVLKRLEDAVRDGDTVWAVIKGAALNNDGGEKSSFTAPHSDAHAEVISLAHAIAGFEPESVSYIEGHGTATPIGDPIEVAGLTQAFRQGTERTGFCGLGSLKSNVGHMDAAAGVGGLIKTALALYHKQLPATLHYQKPNPALSLETSPFYVVDKLKPWVSDGPLRAGVSSFGVGGTNAHCALQEAPALPASPQTRPEQIIVLSAKSAVALDEQAQLLAAAFDNSVSGNLSDIAWTLQTGRAELPFRRAISAADFPTAAAALRRPAAAVAATTLKTVFLFPGQGAQHLRMGAETYAQESVFRAAFDECAAGFLPHVGLDIRQFLEGGSPELAPLLTETRYTQPALFAVEYALARLWISWGVQPDAMIGHSIGEYVAAVLSGVMTLADALRLVAVRGRVLWQQPRGSMLAVRLPVAEVRALLPSELDIAAINAPSLTVVSGAEEDVKAFAAALESAGHTARLLHTSHAFHSRMMDGALDEFHAAFTGVTLSAPQVPYYANATGALADEAVTGPDYYLQQIRGAVRFSESVAAAAAEGPCLFIECGPGTALAPLVKQTLPGALAVSSFPESKQEGAGEYLALLENVGRAWGAGSKVDWLAIRGGHSGRKVPLPLYPFERKRYAPDTVLPEGTMRDGEGWLTLGSGGVVEQTPQVTAPAEMAAPVVDGLPRRERLLAELRTHLHTISGIDLSAADARASFFDLGFDSLFLTQASLALKKHFGLKITFRQLMEELISMDLLATWLDGNLPAEQAFTTQPSGAPKSSVAVDGLTPIMVRDLKGSEGKKVAFGPFKPIEKSRDGSMTARQLEHLRQLITDYCARYPKARAFTAEHREVFADPRAVAGFNHSWKDMVFPAVTEGSSGAYLYDTDGHKWIDVVHGFGLGFFGHRPEFVTKALHEQIDKGFEIGPTSPLAGEVAKLIREFSGLPRSAFCNTGSEALMAAIRVSRTVSGRNRIAMFTGGYHGIFDEVLARPLISNGELRSIPVAPGVPESAQMQILVLEYGHPESLEILRQHGEEIACVLVEPVMSRRPDHVPIEFVKELRKITHETKTALVFDEVVLGFRSGPHGAQEHFGIKADLVTYGKVIGGGMPLGVICGERNYMDALDGGQWQYGDDSGPEVGMTFFAGTFIRHPLTMAAARAVLLKLKAEGPALQKSVEEKTRLYVDRLNAVFENAGVPIKASRFSSMWMLLADPGLKYFSLLFYHLRLRGVHLWEGRPGFLSTAHTEEDVTAVLAAFEESVAALQQGGFLPAKAVQLPQGVYPVTPAQQEMYLASQLSPEAAQACHESMALRFEGALQAATVEKALQLLATRHDSLRTTFPEGGETMRIADVIKVELPVVDLSSKPANALDQVSESEFLRPFDLENGPLFRAALVRLAAAEHVLIFTAHHIICDGWSFGVLIHEFPEAMRAAAAGAALKLEVAPTYAAYAQDQDQRKQAGEFATDRSWWLDKYRSSPDPLELPADSPRTGLRRYDAAQAHGIIPAALTARLKAFCKEHRLTPYHVLLGTWRLLMHRLTGSADFITGVPYAAQPARGLMGLTGHCVQFLPLRTLIDRQQSVLSVMEDTRRDMGDASDHAGFTWGELLENLKLSAPERDRFVSTSFSLEPIGGPVSIDGLVMKPGLNPKRRQQFDITVYVFQSEQDFTLTLNYHTALFRHETMERWAGHYVRLLEGLLDNPHIPAGQVPIMSEEQLQHLIHGQNASGRIIPDERTLHGWFSEAAQCFPQRTAVTCEGRALTYAELESRSNQLAHLLIAEGVKPGDLTGICLERNNDLVVAILAVLKAGAAYLPIDLSYPQDRLSFMLEDAGAAVLISQRSLDGHLPTHGGRTLHIDAPELLDALPATVPVVLVSSESTAYVIYTSGSTGLPKGCLVSHRNVVRLMRSTEQWFQFNESDVWTLFHSAAFDFSVWEIWGALLYGGRLVVVPFLTSRSPEEFHVLLSQEQVTVLNQTPSAFRQLIAADGAAALPLALRYVIFGGEALEMPTLKPWFDKHGDQKPELVNMYGITETTVHVTYRPIKISDVQGGSVIGVPIPDLQVYILDADLQPVPMGVAGEIHVGGDGLALGYLNREELTAQRFIPNHLTGQGRLYRAGDLARFLPGGDVEYLGRIDQQVKIRGFRIELGEIESVLATHPQVRECAVLPLTGPDGEKRLCAWLVSGSETAPGLSTLREWLMQKVPAYMVPSSFVFMERFPLTTNGKLDRKALPQPEAESAALAGDDYIEPRTPTEFRLAGLWTEVLGRSQVSATADFFALGGTSLNGLRLFTRIRQTMGVALPLGTLFRAPTLERMSVELDAALQGLGVRPSPLSCIQPKGREIPLICLHGGDGGTIFYRNLLPYVGDSRPIYTIESPSLVDESLPILAESVDVAAANYIKILREARPHGPYILAGYSYGGILAFEMARRLEADGEQVPLVILFDTEHPNYKPRLLTKVERLKAIWGQSQGRPLFSRVINSVDRVSSKLRQRKQNLGQAVEAERLATLGEQAKEEGLRHFQHNEAAVLALETYQTSEWSGRVLLLRCEHDLDDKYDRTEDYGWTPLVGEITIDRISGNHLDIWDDPHVTRVGQTLRRRLDEVNLHQPVGSAAVAKRR